MARHRPSLHLITDPQRTYRTGDGGPADALVAAVARALAGGVDWVQVREKSAPASHLLQLVQAILPLSEPHGSGVLVNDRLDVALAAGAAGVHLSKKSLPPALARQVAGPGMLIGASVHSVEEAVEAARAGADYITFGHVYPTQSKPGLPPRGPALLREVVQAVDVPVLAIGGITVERIPEVLATGCAGIAVIGAVLSSPDPGAAAARLRQALDGAEAAPRFPFPPPPAAQSTMAAGGREGSDRR